METDLPPEVRPLWIEAAFTAEYERDTLPLLFASERIFTEYYDALAQKNRTLSSAIEQIRQENAAARSYRVEGMWRESIEALTRCVELRRAVFDATDFQFVAALRHCMLSMMNFASYFMKEAGNDPDSSMLSRAFELLKRAEEAGGKFVDSTDKLFFRALVENNFALYFMKRKLLKAAAQRLQLAAKSWQAVVPQKGQGAPADATDAVGFYFAVQRGVGECSCARFESGLELFKRAVAVAPQLPEEQDQQRADANLRDEQAAQGKPVDASSSPSQRPAAASSSSFGSAKKRRKKATTRGADSTASDDDDDDERDAHDDGDDEHEESYLSGSSSSPPKKKNKNNADRSSSSRNNNNNSTNNNNNNKKRSSSKSAQGTRANGDGGLPVQVSLQLLGVAVPVEAIAQIALHHNVAVAFIGMRKYRDALPWATKATELLTVCRESLPANSTVVKIVTACSEYCHSMGKSRGNIDYRMKKTEFHQNDHLKKFKSLHSAIKPNAGAAAFEQRRRALQNSYDNGKHDSDGNDQNDNNNGDDRNDGKNHVDENGQQEQQQQKKRGTTAVVAGSSSSRNSNSRQRSLSARGGNSATRSDSRTRSSRGLNNSNSNSNSAANASHNKQSAEALRQYLKSLTYEQLVQEFGPDGKKKALDAEQNQHQKPKKVRETSPRLLQLPKHKRPQTAPTDQNGKEE